MAQFFKRPFRPFPSTNLLAQPSTGESAHWGCEIAEKSVCSFRLLSNGAHPSLFTDIFKQDMYQTVHCSFYEHVKMRRLLFWAQKTSITS